MLKSSSSIFVPLLSLAFFNPRLEPLFDPLLLHTVSSFLLLSSPASGIFLLPSSSPSQWPDQSRIDPGGSERAAIRHCRSRWSLRAVRRLADVQREQAVQGQE
eukprot:754463-Hanusia_phi.AAC.6